MTIAERMLAEAMNRTMQECECEEIDLHDRARDESDPDRKMEMLNEAADMRVAVLWYMVMLGQLGRPLDYVATHLSLRELVVN